MRITRRTFVKGSAALPVLPVIATGCGNDVEPAPIVDVEVGDNPEDKGSYGVIAVPVPKYPDLAPGGAVMLRIAPLPPGTRPFELPPKGVLLIHRAATDGSSEFVATRADCPHLGCPLGYSPKEDQIQCPCHGSRFRAFTDPTDDKNQCAGLVLHLPAQDNLRVYGVTKLGDFVYVDLNKDQSCGVAAQLEVDEGKITITIPQYPVLGEVGGSILAKPAGVDDKLIISRVGASEVITLSSVCTHRRCDIRLRADEGIFRCPCHQSEYDYQGNVLSGPAPRPVKKYPTAFDGTTIVITVA